MLKHTDHKFRIELDRDGHYYPLESMNIVCVSSPLFRPRNINGTFSEEYISLLFGSRCQNTHNPSPAPSPEEVMLPNGPHG